MVFSEMPAVIREKQPTEHFLSFLHSRTNGILTSAKENWISDQKKFPHFGRLAQKILEIEQLAQFQLKGQNTTELLHIPIGGMALQADRFVTEEIASGLHNNHVVWETPGNHLPKDVVLQSLFENVFIVKHSEGVGGAHERRTVVTYSLRGNKHIPQQILEVPVMQTQT